MASINGVKSKFSRGKHIGFEWHYEKEKSPVFENKDDCEKSYIQKLSETPYAPLINGKPYEQQHRIVFGITK